VPVTVHALTLTRYAEGVATLALRVSAGFYVRSLAHDLGALVGTGAHLSGLRRTQAGAFGLEGALTFAALKEAPRGGLRDQVRPLEALLPELTAVPLTADLAGRVRHGQTVQVQDVPEAPAEATVRLLDPAGRLAAIAREVGPVQLVFAGKAHPKDEGGKNAIRRVFAAADRLRERVRVVYLENYDTALAGELTAGADLWLNTPRRPLEASGTSGMKAAHNGVPSLSTLDGWWAEGHVEGVTGWSIGPADASPDRDADAADAEDLYRKNRDGWVGVMRHAIALNASFFNTHRMVQQYAANAYV
jgi:hypothetical protein